MDGVLDGGYFLIIREGFEEFLTVYEDFLNFPAVDGVGAVFVLLNTWKPI